MYKTFDIPPYASKIIIAVDENPSKIVARINLDHQGLEIDYNDDGAGVTYERVFRPKGKKEKRQYCVLVFDANEFGPAIVAHEAVHVVNYIFTDVGIDPDPENDEHQAYLTSWIVEKAFEVWKEYKQHKKQK